MYNIEKLYAVILAVILSTVQITKKLTRLYRRAGGSTFLTLTCNKIRFDITTSGDWDCVAAVECLPALHYSIDSIFSCPLGSWVSF